MNPKHDVTDIGKAGPDKGKGGKYLLLPPDHKGEVPEGYYASKSPAYGNWLVMRGFSVEEIKQLKVCPLAQAGNPPVSEASRSCFQLGLDEYQ